MIWWVYSVIATLCRPCVRTQFNQHFSGLGSEFILIVRIAHPVCEAAKLIIQNHHKGLYAGIWIQQHPRTNALITMGFLGGVCIGSTDHTALTNSAVGNYVLVGLLHGTTFFQTVFVPSINSKKCYLPRADHGTSHRREARASSLYNVHTHSAIYCAGAFRRGSKLLPPADRLHTLRNQR